MAGVMVQPLSWAFSYANHLIFRLTIIIVLSHVSLGYNLETIWIILNTAA
jgi:hypothetical protein